MSDVKAAGTDRIENRLPVGSYPQVSDHATSLRCILKGTPVQLHSSNSPTLISPPASPPTTQPVVEVKPAGHLTSLTHARLELPRAVVEKPGIRFRWTYAISIVLVHAVAMLAVLPWFFSWTGVAVCLAGLYVFGTLGINLGFHRLLTHRSFTCPKWVEKTVAILGVCCLQEGPARWVGIHRKHHQHSDEEPDPHSPLVTFLWGHVGWLVIENRDSDTADLLHRYSRDLVSQRFYLNLEKRLRWFWVYVLSVAAFAAAGVGVGYLIEPTWAKALQFAASFVLWGVFVRTVLVWHITWSVNSLSHLWGYQSFNTGENSRNNWFVALISNGEGWHNNHHGDQRSAAHGHKWYEFDVTYLTIRAMEIVGLARDVKRHDRNHTHDPAAE